MMVLPAPGSSASRKRSGWRSSISPYTAVIWCGSGSIFEAWTARKGSKRWASRIRSASAASRKSCGSASNRRPRAAGAGSRRASSSR